MKKIIIHEDAEKELWHATDYYEDKVVGLGLDFENEIQKALKSPIFGFAKRYKIITEEARRIV